MKKHHLKLSAFGLIIFLVTLGSPLISQAQIENPARRIEDVSMHAQFTNVRRLTGAKVVIADYALLKKDFPHLQNKTNVEIDNWILSDTALMSESQLGQTEVNTEIVTGKFTRTAFRPPAYNRALVFSVKGGIIDGKGFGSPAPLQSDHKNGLATLGEVLREFLYQRLVQKIFDFSSSNRKTVGNYAVIDLGFRVKHADGTTSPAGGVLRQAHQRMYVRGSFLNNEDTVEVETTLRKFGVTSAGAYRQKKVDLLNVQGTHDGAIIDFGGFLTVSEFTKVSTAFYGVTPLMFPETPGFVQPDENLRVPLNMWGTGVAGREDPKADNPWLWSHDLAEDFSSGKATRADVENHMRNFLNPVEHIFQAESARRCSALFR